MLVRTLKLREVKALGQGCKAFIGVAAGFEPSDMRLQNWVCKHARSLPFCKGGWGAERGGWDPEPAEGTDVCPESRNTHRRQSECRVGEEPG